MSSKPTQKTQETPQPMSMPAGLYLVATPIGNMRDITFRALDVLSSVDVIACEDTRVTGKLLNAYSLKKKMRIYNEQSDDTQRSSMVQFIKDGHAIALVSDAGMPLISDPGYKLVRDITNAGLKVTAIPGANAGLTGLQLSALPCDQFSFLGFLPPREHARKKALQYWSEFETTLILYETAPRLINALRDIHAILGDRQVAMTRELTKMFEEIKRGRITTLINELDTSQEKVKGEIVLIIGPPDEESQAPDANAPSLEEQIKMALQTMSVRDAAETVARASGKPRKAIYTLALKLSGK